MPTNDTKPFNTSYFTLCVVVKDQNQDIREWVHYHHWLGAEEIYVYDHNSTIPLSHNLEDWIRSGVVVYNFFAGRHKVKPKKSFTTTGQAYAYRDCLERARGRHRWIAFIDADEFLVLSGANKHSMPDFLRAYEAYGAVAVNWRVFGSSGHVTKPNISTMEAYTKCIPDYKRSHNIHVKTIAHVPHTRSLGGNPHTFKYFPGFYPVNEDFVKCETPQCVPVAAKQIALHHYTLKSLEEYQVKMKRGGGSGSTKKMDFFNSINRHADADCMQGATVARECCALDYYGIDPDR